MIYVFGSKYPLIPNIPPNYYLKESPVNKAIAHP